jgi:hypothetical protein
LDSAAKEASLPGTKASANRETKCVQYSAGRDFRRHRAGKHLCFQFASHRPNIGVIP